MSALGQFKSKVFFPGLRLVAVFVLVCFTTTSVAWSAPSLSTGQGAQHLEIPVVSLAEKIAIPSELGTIKEIYTPQPNSPGGSVPVIVHLEDAHGSTEAQLHQEKILRNLQEQYGLNTFFVEGGIGDFQPELLHFFKDSELNDKLIDKLTEVGIVGGVERFLSTPSAVRAYGVENAALYQRELELFREVYNGKAESDKFLGKMRQTLLSQSASSPNKELKIFFREWLFQEELERDILSHLSFLQKYARETLALDLTDVREQYDWPALVRFFKIKKIEQEARRVQGIADSEKQKLEVWLDKSNLKAFRPVFEEIFSKPYALNPNPFGDIRSQMERFYEAAAPAGFKFSDYPNLSRQIGLRILSGELQAPDLLVEVERLNGHILQKLAVTPGEKELVASYQNYFLLRKLLALELTRGEFEEFSRGLETRGQRPETKVFSLKSEVPSLSSQAVEFYKVAQQREKAIFENMLARMKETKQPNAVLVTGGFHSEGLSKFFKDSGVSFVRVAPRISGKVDGANYLRLMTLGGSFSPAVSHARQPSPADLLLKTTMPKYFGLYRDAIQSISKDLLERQPKTQHATVAPDMATGVRSEMRKKETKQLIRRIVIGLAALPFFLSLQLISKAELFEENFSAAPSISDAALTPLMQLLDGVDYTVFDTETTGFSTKNGDRIIEIGAIRVRKGEEIGRFHSLVNPGRPLSAKATEVNHITDNMLVSAPPMEKVMPEFLRFISGSVLFAHNAAFDIRFMNNELALLNLPSFGKFRVFDSLKIARFALPELKDHKLQTLIEHFGFSDIQEHRALSDVEMTVKNLKKMADLLPARGVKNSTDFLQFLVPSGEKPSPEKVLQPSPADSLLKASMSKYFGLYRDEIKAVSQDPLERQPEIRHPASSFNVNEADGGRRRS